MRARTALAAAAIAGAGVLGAATARAYCRTTTCDPQKKSCTPDPKTGCVAEGLKLLWAGRCLGFDLQQDALPGKISLEQATGVAHNAFATWQNATCAPSGKTPSIQFSDLGPVACTKLEYNKNHGNANIIVFRPGTWPYAGSANTLALTTVTFNVDSGEIYDADMEINGDPKGGKLVVGIPAGGQEFDLQYVITHEAGHFLGFAHTSVANATMYATYGGGPISRALSADDVAAVCETYPPTRETPACNPEPRHGFAGSCGDEQGGGQGGGGSGCAASPARAPAAGGIAIAAVLAAIAARSVRGGRRRR